MYEKTTPRMREELIKLRPYTRYLIDEIPGRIRADLTKAGLIDYSDPHPITKKPKYFRISAAGRQLLRELGH